MIWLHDCACHASALLAKNKWRELPYLRQITDISEAGIFFLSFCLYRHSQILIFYWHLVWDTYFRSNLFPSRPVCILYISDLWQGGVVWKRVFNQAKASNFCYLFVLFTKCFNDLRAKNKAVLWKRIYFSRVKGPRVLSCTCQTLNLEAVFFAGLLSKADTKSIFVLFLCQKSHNPIKPL